VRLQRAVLTSEKFTVQLSALYITRDVIQRLFLYLSKKTFSLKQNATAVRSYI